MAAWRGAPRLRYRGRPVLAWLYRVAVEHGQRPAEGTDARAGSHRACGHAGRRRSLGRGRRPRRPGPRARAAPGRPAARGPSAPGGGVLVRRGGPGHGPKRRCVPDARAARRSAAARAARAGGCACRGLTSARRPAGWPRCSTAPSRATPMSPPSRACSATPPRRPGSMSPAPRSRRRSSAPGRARATPAKVAAPHRRRRPGRRASSSAVALVLALPFTSGPADVEVQARALAALGGGGQGAERRRGDPPGAGRVVPDVGPNRVDRRRTATGSAGRSPSTGRSWPRRWSTTAA